MISKSSLIIVTTILLGASMAQAKDWNGVYLGAHAGAVNGPDKTDILNIAGGGAVAGVDMPGEIPVELSGALAGVHAGYTHELDNNIVLGFEVDIDFGEIVTDGRSNGGTANLFRFINTAQSLENLSSLRARGGYLVTPETLIYATGGLGYGEGSLTTTLGHNDGCIANQCHTGSAAKDLLGWVAGAGVEHKVIENISLRLEYLHFDLGKISHDMIDPDFVGIVYGASADYTVDAFRVGANYQF